MTTRELIALLQTQDPDMPVVIDVSNGSENPDNDGDWEGDRVVRGVSGVENYGHGYVHVIATGYREEGDVNGS